MISKQDFDLINRYIAQRNAANVTFKFLVIFTFGITALLFLCIGIVLPNVFFGMCLLAGLLMLPVILVLRIKPEPSYTFGQLVQIQAAHKFQRYVPSAQSTPLSEANQMPSISIS